MYPLVCPAGHTTADGCAAWATVNCVKCVRKLFLYHRPHVNRWVIASNHDLDSTSQFAYIAASSDGLLPEGEAVWTSNKCFRGMAEGEEWMATVLTLSVGTTVQAEPAGLEVCERVHCVWSH